MTTAKWDSCISHRGNEIDRFIAEYFALSPKCILLVGGAGFDPRASEVAAKLASSGGLIRGLFLKEERPDPSPKLVKKAQKSLENLRRAVREHRVAKLDIFGTDGAVIGGREAVEEIRKEKIDGITDVAVDISALSIGTSFPIIQYLVEKSNMKKFNLHLFVSHNPDIDDAITPNSSDVPGYVLGFKGNTENDEAEETTKLWLPQLPKRKTSALASLHSFVEPHDICPILPFPAGDPKATDRLVAAYLNEFENRWSVDASNIVYADESDPLDLYRTILRLGDLRKKVFAEVGGSQLVLSPLGSKVLALGALMAAIEHDLPVAYLEAVGYEIEGECDNLGQSEMIHIWLEGDVYPLTRQ